MTSIKRDKSWERCYRPVILALRRLSRKKFETSPSQSKTLPQKQNKTTTATKTNIEVTHQEIYLSSYLSFTKYFLNNNHMLDTMQFRRYRG
jgi:hypothetical protein